MSLYLFSKGRSTNSEGPGRVGSVVIGKSSYEPICHILNLGVVENSPQSTVQFTPPRLGSFCLVLRQRILSIAAL